MTMKKVMILSALLLSSSAFADERAEIMANNCAGCHGTDGVVENSALISIAGLKADVFIQTMNDFRSNERSSTIMRNVALALTDDEIAAMAKYFESLPTGEEK
jgi:sulfide dehydrogenase cytochrome subunit